MTGVQVSIVIPTRNGRATIAPLLESIARQKIAFGFETIAIDSGSTDGTAEFLDGRVAQLIRIPPASFNHGLTRNLGVARARGGLAVLIVQDALPASDTWLDELTRPLFRDSRLAGTYARQIARPDASAVTRHHLARYAATTETPRVTFLDADELSRLAPLERLDRCTFDNVCSCIRRSVWREHPFRATPIAEDVEWAKEVLLAGHGLAYVPTAAVVHSHDRAPRHELRRTYLAHQRLRALFGVSTIPSASRLMRAIASSLVAHARWIAADRSRSRPLTKELARGLGLAVAWPVGQYLGARSARRASVSDRSGRAPIAEPSQRSPAERVRRIAAVVVHYGTPDDTWLAIHSLRASRHPVDVIVVDNDAPEPGADVLSDVHDVTVIRPGRNVGFAAGANAGIRAALARGAERVLLVNSDVIMPPDAVEILDAALAANPRAGIAGPVLLSRSDPDVVESLGIDYARATGRMRHRGARTRWSQVMPSPASTVDAVSGAVMLIDRRVIERIGLLSEEFFFSFEDVDFCLRASDAGLATVVVGAAVAYHEGSRTIGRRAGARIYFATRNHLLVARRADPASRFRQLARAVFIVALNLAYALARSPAPLHAGLGGVARGAWHHARRRYGNRS